MQQTSGRRSVVHLLDERTARTSQVARAVDAADPEALQALRGIALVSAVTIVAGSVMRYSELRGGDDDRLTCAGTVDAFVRGFQGEAEQ